MKTSFGLAGALVVHTGVHVGALTVRSHRFRGLACSLSFLAMSAGVPFLPAVSMATARQGSILMLESGQLGVVQKPMLP